MKTIFAKWLSHLETTAMPKAIILLIDVLIAIFTYALVMFLVYGFTKGELHANDYVACMVTTTAASLAAYLFTGSYRSIIRHSGLGDIFRLLLTSLFILGVLFILEFISNNIDSSLTWTLTYRQSVIYTLALFSVLLLSRVLIKDIYNRIFHPKYAATNVLIYGAGNAGILAKSALLNERGTEKPYHVKAFIDDDTSKTSKTIDDVRVLSPEKVLTENYIRQNGIEQLVIALPSAPTEVQQKAIQQGLELGLKVKNVPHIQNWINNTLTEKQIKDVRIEDLLGRPEIQISLDQIRQEFGGKVVMVTGAAGSIGSELCRQLATFGIKKLVLFDNAETPMHNLRLELEEKFPDLKFVPIIGDVRQEPRLDFAFRTHRPQVVFHAAAYKHVPLMEENPCEAVLVNVIGSRQVADKCIWYGAEKMVMISTDKAVNPTNVMGCSKRLAEIYVQSLGLAIAGGSDAMPRTMDGSAPKTRFVTTRFGNVLGSNGSVIPRFRAQIAAGGPVTVTHPDITRFFMSIPEACRLVMEAATLTTGNQIFVFDMGKSVKIADMARNMIRLSGLTPDKDIQIVFTGLRPGEKLYEEVLSNTENTLPTKHERIRIAKVREYNYADMVTTVEKLEALSRAVDIPTTVKLMKATVPEFISNNSIYEQYDKKKEE